MEIYLGIYIRGYRKMVESTKVNKLCPNHHFTINTQVYCSKCGEKLHIEIEPEKVQLKLHKMFSEELIDYKFEDYFSGIDSKDNTADILIPNYSDTGFGEFLSEEGEFTTTCFVKFGKFKEKYAEFIMAIEPHYKEIKYDYGVVICYD